jgi:hypothetical protein
MADEKRARKKIVRRATPEPPPQQRHGYPAPGAPTLADLLAKYGEPGPGPTVPVENAIAWVREKWGERPCPYCQHLEWQVGTPLEIPLASGEVMSPTMSPTFPVMCGNCGNTVLVNAILAGLVPEPRE